MLGGVLLPPAEGNELITLPVDEVETSDLLNVSRRSRVISLFVYI